MVFHLSPSDCQSLQVSRTLLCILVDLSNAVVWMVSETSFDCWSKLKIMAFFVVGGAAAVTVAVYIVSVIVAGVLSCRMLL